MDVRVITTEQDWNELAEGFGAHPMQMWQWGSLKEQTGPWCAHRLEMLDSDGTSVGGAQVLVRKMPWPFGAIAYAPRGPFSADGREGWEKSETSLINKTAVIDLTRPEDEIMAGIPNRKCRQYIRKGERDGVVVRPGEAGDLDQILALYHQTAEADGFPIHEDEFYRTAFTALEGSQQLFVAEKDGELQAFLWNVTSKGGCAFELWGAVSDAGKRSRANYYMKWVAIRAAKEAGAKLYDLNGLLNDGISDFKLLFVPEPTYWVETHDKPLGMLFHVMDKALEIRRVRNERGNAQQDTSRD